MQLWPHYTFIIKDFVSILYLKINYPGVIILYFLRITVENKYKYDPILIA